MLSWLYAEEGSSKQRDTQKMKLFEMSQREIKSTRNPFLFHLSADHAYNEIYFVYSQHLIRALIHDARLHFIVEKHVTRIITGNAESVTIRRQAGRYTQGAFIVELRDKNRNPAGRERKNLSTRRATRYPRRFSFIVLYSGARI